MYSCSFCIFELITISFKNSVLLCHYSLNSTLAKAILQRPTPFHHALIPGRTCVYTLRSWSSPPSHPPHGTTAVDWRRHHPDLRLRPKLPCRLRSPQRLSAYKRRGGGAICCFFWQGVPLNVTPEKLVYLLYDPFFMDTWVFQWWNGSKARSQSKNIKVTNKVLNLHCIAIPSLGYILITGAEPTALAQVSQVFLCLLHIRVDLIQTLLYTLQLLY